MTSENFNLMLRRQNIRMLSFLICFCVTASLLADSSPEWVTNNQFRIAVTVDEVAHKRINTPVGIEIDFGKFFSQSRIEGRFNCDSIRVVGFDPARGKAIHYRGLRSKYQVPHTMTGDFVNDDQGMIWWRMNDARQRHFHIYFDTLKDRSKPQRKTVGLVGIGDTFHYNHGKSSAANAAALHSQYWHIDWDGDGLRDLIGWGYGVYEHGMALQHPDELKPTDRLKQLDSVVYFFKNVGTARQPLFASRYRMKDANGQYLQTGFVSQNMFPADWDGDGDIDFYGIGPRRELLLWENTGARNRNGLALLAPPRTLMKLDQLSEYQENTPFVLGKRRAFSPRGIRRIDWEGDGDFDFIVSFRRTNLVRETARGKSVMPYGGGIQIFNLFENTGSVKPDTLQFAKPITIHEERGLPLFGMSYATGCVEYFDWDRDGDNDILFHDGTVRPLEGGRLMFAENRGSRQEPLFSMPIPILKVSESPVVVDWNDDGRFDLMAGGEFFENMTPHERTARKVVPRTATGTRIPHGWSFPKFVSRGFAQQINPEILTYFTISIDWDADGNLDLLGGYHTGLRLFRNKGTTLDPIFESPIAVRADGKPIDMPNFLDPQADEPITWGPQGPSEPNHAWLCPTVGDWDGDGDIDLFVTAQRWQTVYFENIGTRAVPRLARGREVRCDGRIEEFSWRSKVSIGDIDGDGIMEMVVTSNHENVFYMYEPSDRQDDPTVLDFGRGKPLLLENGEPIKGWFGGQNNNGDNHSLLVDWDGDGDLDLLNGSLWTVWYYENVGGPKQPHFRSHGRFQIDGDVIHTFNHAGSFDAADWNGDGLLDLVLSTECPSDQPRGAILHLFDRSFLEGKLPAAKIGEVEKRPALQKEKP
jgi:hypothetical protein